MLALSHFLTNDGLYEEALVAINRSIDIDPIFIAAYNIRGIINMHLGKYDLALKDFQKTIEIDSENLNSYYWSSVLYELMHDKHNSQKMWEILKFLNPEVESKLPIKINIFLSNKGKEAFDEYYIINALLESKYQDAIELLKKNKKLLFNYQMLNKMPLFNPIRDEKIFIELVENKKSEYITLKTKYGNLDFLDL